MQIHGKIKSTTVNGPGNRSIIHFQGCDLGCVNCWNLQSHPKDSSKEETLLSLINWILENAVDGLTLSGGEPMQQANKLFILLNLVKRDRPDLSIGMYTGYTLKELEQGKYKYSVGNRFFDDNTVEYWQIIKSHLDFAIMGRFNEQKLDTSTSLRSSTNQELVLFSDRYKESDFTQQEIEFTLKEGLIQITGFPVGMPSLLESRNW